MSEHDEKTAGGSPTPEDLKKKMKWYFVHTYSGYENKAKLSLEQNIINENLQDHFGEILVPTESVVETVKSQKRTTKRKFFPSYLLVQMVLTEQTWHIIKDTPKITGFVGHTSKPPAVPEAEIMRLKAQIADGVAKPKPKIEFEENETVRVMDGPFANFTGVVEEVKPEKGESWFPYPSSDAQLPSSWIFPRWKKNSLPGPKMGFAATMQKDLTSREKRVQRFVPVSWTRIAERGRSFPREGRTNRPEEYHGEENYRTDQVAIAGRKGQSLASVGPALGQHGVNIMEFVKQYNARTQKQIGTVIPVLITVFSDRSSPS